PAPKADPPAPKVEAAAHKDPEAWTAVVEQLNGADVGKAITMAEDYRHQHPSESMKELDSLIDDALDRLWWDRVTELCKDTNEVQAKLKAKDKEIREETSAAFKKTLLEERKPIEIELKKKQ